MKIFNLPDLGEGLPEAEIREWFIRIGDEVKTDQTVAAVETAKALVDIPAPFDGKIEQLFGEPGDTIKTGNPFIGFSATKNQSAPNEKKATVVGEIQESDTVLESQLIEKKQQSRHSSPTPAIRALARKLKVDLNRVSATGSRISADDVKQAASIQPTIEPHFQALPAVKQAMSQVMSCSQQSVAASTVTADADITHWFKQDDITLRTIQALLQAIQQEPILNSHFNSDNNSYRQFEQVNIGLAVDTTHGLYVPVIKQAEKLTNTELRSAIDTYKQQAESKSISQDNLKDATIVLSNFGRFAAKYGTPIITPPTVCIIGIGRVYEAAIAKQGQVNSGYLLPISISADHRMITGGEVTRFLAAFQQQCEA